MSNYDFLQYISPIIAALNCGHTYLDYSEIDKNEYLSSKNFLPLDIKIINNNFYILKDLSNNKIPRGARLLSINRIETSRI